jgi:protein TonB
MTFIDFRWKKENSIFPYIALSISIHLVILLISKIIPSPPSLTPKEYQMIVRIVDIPKQSKKITKTKAVKKSSLQPRKKRQKSFRIKPTSKYLPKQLPPAISAHTPEPTHLSLLQKNQPIIRRTEKIHPRGVYKAQVFLEAEESQVYVPQITHKEELMAKPRDIGRGEVLSPGLLSPSPPLSQSISREGVAHPQKIRIKEKYGFKPPARALSIGDSSMEEKTSLRGKKYIPLDSKDPNLAPYLSYIKERILQFWRYPAEAEPGLQGKIDLAFTIERDGSVSEIKVIHPSQYKILDKGVLEALGRAAPFKPIPSEIKEKRLPLLGVFIYNRQDSRN